MLSMQTDAFMACDTNYKNADIVMFSAPFDGTTSFRPGTRFAGGAIRRDSYGLETFSPYQDADLLDCRVLDSGELDLPIGDPLAALKVIKKRTAAILKDGKIPFMIGGEHLVTLGAFGAVAEKYPDVHIIHFDAHADLRNDYLGVKLSHACVIRRCYDIIGDGRIFQFGIRSGDKSEFEWKEGKVTTRLFDFEGLYGVLEELKGKPVYFTLDLDVLDPSVFPGTGTPEPGGVTFDALRKAATAVCRRADIVGCDVNELSPPYDQSGISTAAACKIIREMLIALENKEV